MRKAGQKWSGAAPQKAHALREGRRVPIRSLMRKLNVESYNWPAPLSSEVIEPAELVLPLKQSAGVPNRPLVKVGDRVRAGQPLGEVPANALGVPIHAPYAGTVTAVTPDRIHLSKAS